MVIFEGQMFATGLCIDLEMMKLLVCTYQNLTRWVEVLLPKCPL